jgi:hypothetical protein
LREQISSLANAEGSNSRHSKMTPLLLTHAACAGMTLAELTEKARQRANTAGAPDVLNFLRNHVAKVRHLSSTCIKQRTHINPA